ncbi:MAG: WYL domain-containing protein [Planctomycetota bacterium]
MFGGCREYGFTWTPRAVAADLPSRRGPRRESASAVGGGPQGPPPRPGGDRRALRPDGAAGSRLHPGIRVSAPLRPRGRWVGAPAAVLDPGPRDVAGSPRPADGGTARAARLCRGPRLPRPARRDGVLARDRGVAGARRGAGDAGAGRPCRHPPRGARRPPAAGGGTLRAGLLAAINRSIRQRLQLQILYRGQGDRDAQRRTIEPEALVLYDGVLYVAACPVAKGTAAAPGLRFFKLDRVEVARVTKRPFPPRAVSVADELGDSITIYRSATVPPRRFRLRVAPHRARWACEKPFHPRQQVTRLADGSVELVIPRAWDDELVPQLLALEEWVEVLEPADVRERIAATAERIVALYRRPRATVNSPAKG